jgi:exodeoxyribonuclease V beta subunit
MPPIIHNNFNPLTVLLEDSNLIEASAGTGKTYSIALLALRLIIEKDYRVDEILENRKRSS